MVKDESVNYDKCDVIYKRDNEKEPYYVRFDAFGQTFALMYDLKTEETKLYKIFNDKMVPIETFLNSRIETLNNVDGPTPTTHQNPEG
jgi:hypothetical protein